MAKKITCREMGGVCDEAISADTLEEMEKKGPEHAHSATDEAHKELCVKMDQSTEADIKNWKENLKQLWDKAPDA